MDQSLAGLSLSLCSVFTLERLLGRANCRLKVLWPCLFPSTSIESSAWLQKMAKSGSEFPLPFLEVLVRVNLIDSWEFPFP